MLPELKDLFDAISNAANTTTLLINFKSLGLKIPSVAVKEFYNNDAEVSKILDLCFYRKQVMWENHSYEDIDWCMNSLKDLRDNCDSISESFPLRKDPKSKDFVFANLLRAWANYCDEAYKDILKLELTGKSLQSILSNFRKKAYPIVVTFIYALPDGYISRINALQKLEYGVKNSNLHIRHVIPNWSIEL
ncbi:hypothetical protein GCM10023189_41820 [Nibrella saemangeumensis]|uniref:Uncharacterized protein n=1 Tax=Nibrella saemangeumensis TaxID=1084526 RepID=A0ABP8N9I6_9BACT